MHRLTAAELIARIGDDRREISRRLSGSRLEPFLGVELTLHQLRIVLLVATGTATTGREVAECLHVSASAVSSSVDKLVELGYLSRDASDPDRRVKHLSVTTAGTRIYDQFLGFRDEADEYLAALDPADLAALAQGTAALRRAIHHRMDGVA
ncbi:MarR family transcriptional regulator [Microbacterium sp. 18062]|uniref:MarR family transcriptional regulator n=1 Tax=Microbacterium sp. 18062 TaxID=2681410 RepID=UPI00135C96B3|nr:MarR family transcriptional regulator [Microbacterium sp. 18062]